MELEAEVGVEVGVAVGAGVWTGFELWLRTDTGCPACRPRSASEGRRRSSMLT